MALAARPLNHWDIAKLIALLLMFIDHSGAFFFQEAQWLRGIGRGAAPIFLFLAGYAASYRFKPYLLLLAVAMTLSDYWLVGHLRLQNILYSIIACRLLFDWMEKRGKTIARPFEWYVSSLALLSSLFIVQYGTLGLMFAVGGYMQRRPDYYSEAQRRLYLRLSFATYAALEIWLSSFTLLPALLTLASVYGVYRLLLATNTQPVAMRLPHWLARTAKTISYYSGTIYALHLIALEWLTGIPF
jgi:hypothetical protein